MSCLRNTNQQSCNSSAALQLGGAHSHSSALSLAEYWSIWLRTKRMRRESVSSCLFFQISVRSAWQQPWGPFSNQNTVCVSLNLYISTNSLIWCRIKLSFPTENAFCSCWNIPVWTRSLLASVSSGWEWLLLVHSWSSSSHPLICCQLVLWRSLHGRAAHPEQTLGLRIASQISQPLTALSLQACFKKFPPC